MHPAPTRSEMHRIWSNLRRTEDNLFLLPLASRSCRLTLQTLSSPKGGTNATDAGRRYSGPGVVAWHIDGLRLTGTIHIVSNSPVSGTSSETLCKNM